MRPRFAGAVFVVLLATSLAMFLTPGEEVPKGGPNDKVTHLVIFVVLALAGRWARVPWLLLGIGLASYAALTEVLQATLPINRDGDVRDWLADVAGIALGLLLSRAAAPLAARARPPRSRLRWQASRTRER